MQYMLAVMLGTVSEIHTW